MWGIFNQVTDPVCKMKTDKKSGHFSEYQGNRFYFCSENCQKTFDRDPQPYVSQPENVQLKGCC